VIPTYDKLQVADQLGDINENFDDNDSCNISNMSSSSRQENNQRAEMALSVKSCSDPNNNN
jgi:hypothetical protein